MCEELWPRVVTPGELTRKHSCYIHSNIIGFVPEVKNTKSGQQRYFTSRECSIYFIIIIIIIMRNIVHVFFFEYCLYRL